MWRLDQAITNTRALIAEWDQPGARVEVGDDVQNIPLFELPQEPS